MIKLKLPLKLSAFALAALSYLTPFKAVHAVNFEETEVDQNQFIGVALPYGDNKYNLIVIEQIPGKQPCWNQSSANPMNVDLLLLNFDFSGHCRRSTDSNGYSIRFNGQDLGLDYLLTLVEKNGELNLIGINRLDRGQPNIVVGKTQGITGQPMLIELNPGWQYSKRTYQGKVLGHVYFSYSDSNVSAISETSENNPLSNSSESPESFSEEIIAPETNPDEIKINESPQVEDNSQSFRDSGEQEENMTPSVNNSELVTENSELENEDSQAIGENNEIMPETEPPKKPRNPVTVTPFERMRSR
jgi:hypothetical protein